MPKRHHLFVVAAFGCLSAERPNHGDSSPKFGNYQRDEGFPDRGVVATKEDAKATVSVKPCEHGKENRTSDLCAEWKAADAAQEAADYTRLAFYAALTGALLALLALFYTVKGTRAAIEAVDAQIASDRPLLMLSNIIVTGGDAPSRTLYVRSFLSNHGVAGCWTECSYVDFSGVEPTSIFVPESPQGNRLIGFIPSHDAFGPPEPYPVIFSVAEFEPLIAGRRLYVHGWSIYRDAAGRRWKTGSAGLVELDEHYVGSGFLSLPSEALWHDEELPRLARKKPNKFRRLLAKMRR